MQQILTKQILFLLFTFNTAKHAAFLSPQTGPPGWAMVLPSTEHKYVKLFSVGRFENTVC